MRASKHVHLGRDHMANGNVRKAAAHFARADELGFGVKTRARRGCHYCGEVVSPTTSETTINRCQGCRKKCHPSCCPTCPKVRGAIVGDVPSGPSDEGMHATLELKSFRSKNEDYYIAQKTCNELIKRLNAEWLIVPRQEARAMMETLTRVRTQMCTLFLEMIDHWASFRLTLGDPTEVQNLKTWIFGAGPFMCDDGNPERGQAKIETTTKELIRKEGLKEGDDTKIAVIYTLVKEWRDGDLQSLTAEFLRRRDATVTQSRHAQTTSGQTHDASLYRHLKAYHLDRHFHALKQLGLKTIHGLEMLLLKNMKEMNKIFSGNLALVYAAIESEKMPAREASADSEPDTGDTGALRQNSDPLTSRIHTEEQANAARAQAEADEVTRMRWALQQRLFSENEGALPSNEQKPEEISCPEIGVPAKVQRIVGIEPECLLIRFENVLMTAGKRMDFWEGGLHALVSSIPRTDLSRMTRTVLLFERNGLNEPNRDEKIARITKNEGAVKDYRATRGADDATRNAMNQRLNELCHDTRDAKDNPMANCLWKAAQDHTYDWAFVSSCILFTLYCVSVRLQNFMSHATKQRIPITVSQVVQEFQETPIRVWIYGGNEIFDAIERIHQKLETFYKIKHGGVDTLQAKLNSPDTSSKILSKKMSTWRHFQTIRSICDGVRRWDTAPLDFRACVFADTSHRATIWAAFQCGLKEGRDEGVAEVLWGDFWVGQRVTMTQDDKDPASFSVQNLDIGEELELILVQCTYDIYVREGGQLMPGCHVEKV